MRLALAADVISELGFDTMVNISRATLASLDYATEALAGALETTFDSTFVVDQWFIKEPNVTKRFGNYYTELKLSQGMIQATPTPPVAIIAPNAVCFNQDSSNYVNNTTALTFQLERGVAIDLLTPYWSMWLQISYAVGFPVPDAGVEIPTSVAGQAANIAAGGQPLVYDGFTYDLTVVPKWLQMAAKLHAKIALQSNPSLEDPAIKMDTKLLQNTLAGILKPRSRYAPAAQLPVNSSVISGTTIQATATDIPIDPLSEETLIFLPMDETGI